jgi:hypothetical protein
MVDKGIIVKVGGRYINGDDEIGTDINSAISRLKAANYSKEYSILKAKLAEMTKGKKPKVKETNPDN